MYPAGSNVSTWRRVRHQFRVSGFLERLESSCAALRYAATLQESRNQSPRRGVTRVTKLTQRSRVGSPTWPNGPQKSRSLAWLGYVSRDGTRGTTVPFLHHGLASNCSESQTSSDSIPSFSRPSLSSPSLANRSVSCSCVTDLTLGQLLRSLLTPHTSILLATCLASSDSLASYCY